MKLIAFTYFLASLSHAQCSLPATALELAIYYSEAAADRSNHLKRNIEFFSARYIQSAQIDAYPIMIGWIN